MRRDPRPGPAPFLAVLSALAWAAAGSVAMAQPVPPVRLSVATDGTPANGASTLLAVSHDGRTVLFTSSATNLVPGTTTTIGLFVRDRDTDRDGILDEAGAVRTVRVSDGPSGQQIDDHGLDDVRLSPSGRFVLFSTSASLIATDTNGQPDVYLRDRDSDEDGVFDQPAASTLTCVSTGSGNTAAIGGGSRAAGLSDDGRYVLFLSGATNLQPRSTTVAQFYRKDRLTSLTTLASGTPDGTPADQVVLAALSPDGQRVLLAGGFAALSPLGTTSGHPWVLRDLAADTFTPIALPTMPLAAVTAAAGTAVAAPLIIHEPRVDIGFSSDGQHVFFEERTIAIGVVNAFTGSVLDYDVATGRVVRHLTGIPGHFGLLPRVPELRDDRQLMLLGSFTQGEVLEAIRFDRTTGRVTPLATGPTCLGLDSRAGRTLFCGPGASGVLLLDERFGVPLPMPADVRLGQLDATASTVLFTSDSAAILPGGVDTNGVADVFAVDLPSRFDRDGDGLDDRWEIAMGLDVTSGAGSDGAAGDPDGDGVTNLQEQTAGSHPRGGVRQFLAEGADNAFFKTRLAIANPGVTDATAVVRLDGDDGTTKSVNVHVPARARRTLFVDEVAGHGASFSTTVESGAPLVSERTMSWDATEYGAHAERASAAPATTWFLAEGATGAFSLFYLLQNPGDTGAAATIRYLRPAPLPPIERTYTLAPHSRTTLPVERQAPELAATDVSASITSTQPILVERAMYRSVPGQPFAAGHASAGVTAAATGWFLAEGATGPFFDLFILLANPNVTDATVEIRYLLTGGTVLTKTYAVPAESRRTIYVDAEEFPGLGQALANVAVSCAITSTNAVPIVVERSMWFPGPEISPLFWTEAHNSPGATATARRWVLADGEAGGTKATQTYVLIANTSATPGRARLTILGDRATAPAEPTAPLIFDVALPPSSRTTVAMNGFAALADARFGVLIESIDTTPLADLVVERAMYWNSGGVTWAAGTNLLATPIP